MRILKQITNAQSVVMSGKPTVISLFAGGGGSSLGYKWAGFNELLAIDFDPHAVETFKLNFPKVPVWQRDITEVTGKEILKACGIRKGQLDILDGSPPCQGFSTAGKRNINDSRNQLFKSYVRLINELQPKVFVMENVTGMARGKMKGMFIEIMNELKATGYNVKCKKMNSVYYSVPQSRERLIFIGSRNAQPVYPKHHKSVITVREAFRGVPDGLQHKVGGIRKYLMIKLRQGESGNKYHPKGGFYGIFRLHYEKPSRSVMRDSGNIFIHPQINRPITIAEVKRLCSYPDNYKINGSYSQQWARLGNSVMPKFMEAIAKTIKKEML